MGGQSKDCHRSRYAAIRIAVLVSFLLQNGSEFLTSFCYDQSADEELKKDEQRLDTSPLMEHAKRNEHIDLCFSSPAIFPCTEIGPKIKTQSGCNDNKCWHFCGSQQDSIHWCHTLGKGKDGQLGQSYCETDRDCARNLNKLSKYGHNPMGVICKGDCIDTDTLLP